MPGTFSQPPRVSDPDMHHGMFPAFPAHAQPAILRIWQEAHDKVRDDIYISFLYDIVR